LSVIPGRSTFTSTHVLSIPLRPARNPAVIGIARFAIPSSRAPSRSFRLLIGLAASLRRQLLHGRMVPISPVRVSAPDRSTSIVFTWTFASFSSEIVFSHVSWPTPQSLRRRKALRHPKDALRPGWLLSFFRKRFQRSRTDSVAIQQHGGRERSISISAFL